MNTYGLAGLARGLDAGLDRRRRQDIEDERLGLEKQRHDLAMRSGEFGLERAKTRAGQEDELFPLERDTRKVGLESARYGFERGKTEDAQQDEDRTTRNTRDQQDRDHLVAQADQEGFYDFLRAFDKTKDGEVAVRAYNSKGRSKIKPETFKAQPLEDGDFQISFIETDGDKVNERWSVLRKLLPTETITVKDNERVFTRDGAGKLTEVTASARGGAGRGGEYSKFGPSFFRDSATQFFGKYDPETQGFFVEAGMREKAAAAASTAERLYLDHDVDPNDAVRLANLAAGFKLSDKEALAKLRAEAEAEGVQNPDAYAQQNLEKFKHDANLAQREIDAITGGGQRGAKPTAGAKPAAGADKGADPLVEKARAAIARGSDRKQVAARLKQLLAAQGRKVSDDEIEQALGK